MRTRQRFVVVMAAVSAFVALPPAQASACSCMGTPAKELYAGMDAAFTGRLLEKSTSSDGRFAIYRYRVRRDYKGNLREKIRVRTPAFSSCGLSGNTVGKRYSLFLYRSDDAIRRTEKGPWTSNLCLETTRAELEEASRQAESSDAGGDSQACSGA